MRWQVCGHESPLLLMLPASDDVVPLLPKDRLSCQSPCTEQYERAVSGFLVFDISVGVQRKSDLQKCRHIILWMELEFINCLPLPTLKEIVNLL